MSKSWQKFFLLFFVFSFEVRALTFSPSSRHLARANTYLTSATGMEAMILNSSLLALDKTKEYTWPLLSAQIGPSTESVLEIINNAQSLSSFDKIGTLFEDIVGDNFHLDSVLYSGVYGPSWGTTVIADFSFDLNVLKEPEKAGFETLGVNGRLLPGLAFAFYYSVNKDFAVGSLLKGLFHLGVRDLIGIDTFDNIKERIIGDDLKRGFGIGLDLNASYQMSGLFSPRFAVVLENIGGLTFASSRKQAQPRQVNQNLHLGASGSYKMLGGVFSSELNYSTGDPERDKLFQEIRLGLSYVYNEWLGFYTGIMDGYPSVGFSLIWPYLQTDVSFYTVEVGPYPGANPDQRFSFRLLLQI